MQYLVLLLLLLLLLLGNLSALVPEDHKERHCLSQAVETQHKGGVLHERLVWILALGQLLILDLLLLLHDTQAAAHRTLSASERPPRLPIGATQSDCGSAGGPMCAVRRAAAHQQVLGPLPLVLVPTHVLLLSAGSQTFSRLVVTSTRKRYVGGQIGGW